ncbi:MAG: hypothetical protein EON93_24865 [Burkholderiales bacterium]|nr:MAG: hypothetical protein EON93_24865 [Burkholderiales bacterium]
MMLVVIVLGMVGLYPPAQGKMLLVPIWPGAAQGMLARATQQGALLIGSGPLPNSFVVSGSRAAIAEAMLDHGVLLLAAPPTGCGTTSAFA